MATSSPTVYDTVPEFGGFDKKQAGMPTWDEVMNLIKGEFPDGMTEEEWKNKDLARFKLKYMIPEYNPGTNSIRLGSNDLENLQISGKDKVKNAFENMYWYILDIIIHNKMKSTSQRKIIGKVKAAIQDAKRRTSSDKQHQDKYIVKFDALNRELITVTCILNSCAEMLRIYGNNAQGKSDADVFTKQRRYASKILDYEEHAYIPDAGRNMELWKKRFVRPDVLKQAAKLLLDDDDEFCNTKGEAQDIETIIAKLNEFTFQGPDETNQEYVTRVIEERIEQDRRAEANLSYAQLANIVEIPQVLWDMAAEEAGLDDSQKGDKVLILEIIDKLYNEGHRNITSDTLYFITTHLENELKLDQERRERAKRKEQERRQKMMNEYANTYAEEKPNVQSSYKPEPIFGASSTYYDQHREPPTSRDYESRVTQPLNSGVAISSVERGLDKLLGSEKSKSTVDISDIVEIGDRNPLSAYAVRNIASDQATKMIALEMMSKSEELWNQIFTMDQNIRQLAMLSKKDTHYTISMQKKQSKFENNCKEFLKAKAEFDKVHFINFEAKKIELGEFGVSAEALRELAVRKSEEYQELSRSAYDYFNSLDVTSVKISESEAKMGKPDSFTGEYGIGKKSFWEFLERVEDYSKKNIFGKDGKVVLIKSLLEKNARIGITNEMNDYRRIVSILASVYGEFEYVFSRILDTHSTHVRKIPSIAHVDNQRQGDWKQRTDKIGQHLELMERAENLNKYYPGQIYCSRYASVLCGILSSEEAIKFVSRADSDGGGVVRDIKKHLTDEFNAARKMQYSTPRESSTKFQKYGSSSDKDSKHHAEREKTQQHQQHNANQGKNSKFNGRSSKKSFSVAAVQKEVKPYKQDGTRNMRRRNPENSNDRQKTNDVIVQTNPECKVCKMFQTQGYGRRYFEKHICQRGKYILGHCPVYINAPVTQRLRVLKESNACDLCFEQLGSNHKCNVSAKALCVHCNKQGRRIRIENCQDHMNAEDNKLKIDNKEKWFNKNGLNMKVLTVAACGLIKIDPAMTKAAAFLEELDQEAQDSGIVQKESHFLGAINRKVSRKRKYEVDIEELNNREEVKYVMRSEDPVLVYGQAEGPHDTLNLLFDSGAECSIFRDDVIGHRILSARTGESASLKGVTDHKGIPSELWLVKLPITTEYAETLNPENVDFSNEPSVWIHAYSSPQKTIPMKPRVGIEGIFEEVREEILEADGIDIGESHIDSKMELDGIIGMDASHLHPEPLFTTDSGYTVYKSKFRSKSGTNYCIGGSKNNLVKVDTITRGKSPALYLAAISKYGIIEGLRRMNTKIMSPVNVGGMASMEEEDIIHSPGGKKAKIEKYERSMSNTLYGPATVMEEVTEMVTNEETSNNGEAARGHLEYVNEELTQVSHNNSSVKTVGLLGVGDRINEYYKEVMEGYSGIGETIFLDSRAPEGQKVMQSIMNVRDSIRSRDNKDLALAFREDYNKVQVNNKCFKCLECETCKKMDPMEDSIPDEHRERAIMKACIKRLDNGQFQHKLPFKIEEEQVIQRLRGNSNLALQNINRQIKKLKENKESDRIKIKTSFEKLVDCGYIVKFDDLTESEKNIINNKEIQVYIVWNVVYKPSSISTPCRIVFNASQKIGRYSLNDLLMKGYNKGKMDFEKIAISMAADHVAIVMDISKFYNSLLLDPEHYNYQNIYWCYDINEEPPKIERHVIKTCIYGVASSSAMTELCMEIIADENSDNHELVRCFKVGKYVDDICTSRENKEVALKLKDDIVKAIGSHNMKIKGYAISKEIPDPKLVEDGLMHVGGYVYNPLEDVLMVGVPPLDFTGSSQRGRVVGGQFYSGSTIEEMNEFVPEHLTIRITASKTQGVFDCRGIFSPWRLKIKHLQNESRREVTSMDNKCDWDMPLSSKIRQKWVELFHEMTLIKKMKFKRFCPSENADTSQATIIVFTDAAELGAEQVVYVGYKNKLTGLMEIQYLTARNQILPFKPEGDADKQHISRKELESMMLGVCLGQKCKTVVKNPTKLLVFCDNKTALCWTRGEPERLIGYIRKRVKIINQFSSEDDRYYINTKANISDLGTRIDTCVEDCGPDSVWYRGPSFLSDITKAIEDKIIEPLKTLAPTQTEKETLTDGCGAKGHQLPDEYFVMALSEIKNDSLTERELEDRIINDIETPGDLNDNAFGVFSIYDEQPSNGTSEVTKAIMSTAFTREKMKTRKCKPKAKVNVDKIEYLVNVKALGWIRSVNVMSFVLKFVSKLTKKHKIPETQAETLTPLTYRFEEVNVVNKLINKDTNEVSKAKQERRNKLDKVFDDIKDKINYRLLAVEYLMKLASDETRHMYSNAKINRLTFSEKNILYSRSRVPTFTELSALLKDVELKDVGIQSKIFFIGRFTSITVPIIEYFHFNISHHGGRDSTLKYLNSTITIYKGTSLVKKLVRKCVGCRIKNKKKMEVTMGPITNRLRYTYVNSHMFLDGSGPYHILKNKTKMNLRGNPARQKVWVLHSTCAISHFSRAEILADYSTSEFILAFTRICSVTGYPRVVYLDSDSSETKGMAESTFNTADLVRGLKHHCDTELRFCGTTGQSHSRHGAIESRIKSFKKYLNQEFKSINYMTFTAFTTAISLVTNILNSCPLALKSRSNMEAASFITPFTFVQGVQSAERVPIGIGTQVDRQEMLDSIEEFSKGLYSFYSAHISSFLLKHKWSKDTPDEINTGDLVLFQHTVSEISSCWKLGRVEDIEKDSDGEGRIVSIRYSNSNEINYPTSKDKKVKLNLKTRTTRRGTHTIVKIYSINETSIDEDIRELLVEGEEGEKEYFNNN